MLTTRLFTCAKYLCSMRKNGTCLTIRLILDSLTRDTFRFNRNRLEWNTKQTKGTHCRLVLMGLLDDILDALNLSQWAQPIRSRWEQTRRYREPIQEHIYNAYHSVPRADLYLTAIGTAISIVAIRRGLRRLNDCICLDSNF